MKTSHLMHLLRIPGDRKLRLPVLLALSLFALSSCASGPSSGGGSKSTWGGASLVQPAELAATLSDTGAVQPLLLHVGMRALYRAGAIPGSRYVGPGKDAEGIASMLAAVKDEPKDRAIVLYCGCCPAEHCPNMKPAWAAMAQAGFQNVRALFIQKDFDSDWAGKGYPTAPPER